MARKSRKNIEAAAAVPAAESSYYKTAVYVRLSIENSGKDDDGDSIENQTSICKEYITEHPDLKLFDIYEDNGKKGTHFDRPEFQRMMEDVKANNRHIPMDQEHSYYVCGGYLDSGYRNCTRRMIRYPDVEKAVLAVIQGQVAAALDQEKMIRQMRGSTKEKSLIDKYAAQANYITQELKKVNGRREHLYESFTEGVLDEAEYKFAKQKYDDEAADLGKKLSEARARKKQLNEVLTLDNKWLSAMHEAEDKTEVDSDLVKHLIKAVKIYEEKRVEVELNFGEQRQVMERIIGELMEEEADE